MTLVEVSVSIDCAECESKIRKALLKLRGVQEVEIDRTNHRVKVLGSITQDKILKTVRKTGKTAQLFLHPHNPVNHGFRPEYYNQYQSRPSHRKVFTSKVSSYNYHVHGYDNHQFPGYQYQSAASTDLVDDKARYLFSDDNPTGCSIM